jgi:hypothetical protein
MTAEKINSETEIAAADGNARQPYQAPRLVVFGNVARLTQTGTMAAQEDIIQNNSCRFPNMTGNMC